MDCTSSSPKSGFARFLEENSIDLENAVPMGRGEISVTIKGNIKHYNCFDVTSVDKGTRASAAKAIDMVKDLCAPKKTTGKVKREETPYSRPNTNPKSSSSAPDLSTTSFTYEDLCKEIFDKDVYTMFADILSSNAEIGVFSENDSSNIFNYDVSLLAHDLKCLE